MVAFYYLLDTARINAQTIWSLNHGLNPRKTNSYEFGMKVAKALFMPMIMTRPVVGLSSKIRSLCHIVTGNARFLGSLPDIVGQSDSFGSAVSSNKTRCRQCLAEIHGKPGHKCKKTNCPELNRRVKSVPQTFAEITLYSCAIHACKHTSEYFTKITTTAHCMFCM